MYVVSCGVCRLFALIDFVTGCLLSLCWLFVVCCCRFLSVTLLVYVIVLVGHTVFNYHNFCCWFGFLF